MKICVESSLRNSTFKDVQEAVLSTDRNSTMCGVVTEISDDPLRISGSETALQSYPQIDAGGTGLYTLY